MVLQCPHSRPLSPKLICWQPLKRSDEEVTDTAKLVVDNFHDEQVKTSFIDLSVQLCVGLTLLYCFPLMRLLVYWINH